MHEVDEFTFLEKEVLLFIGEVATRLASAESVDLLGFIPGPVSSSDIGHV